MENTLENRLKFYAQHLGQNIIIDSDCFSSESGNDIIHTTLVSVSLKGIECDGWIPVTEHTALERKPLSSITDEDAKTVATIFNYDKEYNALEATRDWCKSISINTRNYFSAFHANYIHAFQFLISKSYALPWMGLSVEQLEEYGWIKLKTKAMTKKQEKIKEAYGHYWGALSEHAKKCALEHNGYIAPIISGAGEMPREFLVYNDSGFRPRSLAGLEDNNGWISISNEGLPQTDESDGFWVMSDDYTFVLDCYFDSYDKEFKIIFQKAPVMNVTHYQPIVKPKPPIY